MAGRVGGAEPGRGAVVPRAGIERARRAAGRAGRVTLAALLALELAVIFAWPWLGAGVRGALDPVQSQLCHREPGRCYEVCGEPMPACARCVGLWLGLAAMAVAAP